MVSVVKSHFSFSVPINTSIFLLTEKQMPRQHNVIEMN